MKKLAFVTFILLSFSVHSQNRYELLDEGKEKIFLSDSISKMAKSGIVTDKPIVVIDGKPYRYQDLENQKLSISKNEIVKIMPIEKQKGKNIYGEFGEAGVLIITTSKPKSE